MQLKTILALVITCLLMACTNNVTGKVTQDNLFVIGGSFALTGDGADWGNDELEAVRLAIDEENARSSDVQFILKVEDTHTDAKGTLSATEKLITQDAVHAIIGPTWGDSFGSIVAPIGEEHGIVQLSPSAALEVPEDTENYPHYFSTWYPQKPEIDAHMQYLKENDLKRVVVIYDADPFNTKFASLYKREAQKNSIDVVGSIAVPIDTQDFRTTLLKVKSLHPEVVLVEIFNVGQLGELLTQAKELDLDVVVMSTASAQTTTLLENYGTMVNGRLVYSYPRTDAQAYDVFVTLFTQRYGHTPRGSSAACAYDAARALMYALRAARAAGEVDDELYRLHMPGTVVETLSFNARGQIANAQFIMKTVQNNAFVELE